MGEREKRLPIFRSFQINRSILRAAKPGAFVMHCLPAHRGEEITEDVFEGPQSIVFPQAENRMHLQKAILYDLMVRKTQAGRGAAGRKKPPASAGRKKPPAAAGAKNRRGGGGKKRPARTRRSR